MAKSYSPSTDSSPSSVPIRLRDIAERLGVSTMTISLALRAHPSISAPRIAEVKKAAREMGYRPNAMATALAHRKWAKSPHAIATAIAWLNHWDNPRHLRRQWEFDRYWIGAEAAAEKLGYRLEEFVWGEGMTHRQLEKILIARNIQGIVVPPHPVPPDWTGWHFEKFSLVRIGHSVRNLPVDVITTDQVKASMMAFHELHSRGYLRIGMVASSWAERNTLFQAGFLLAQSQAHLKTCIPMLGIEDAPTGNAAKDAAKLQSWIRKFKPDAILTDVNGMQKMLASLGLGVPKEIGLLVLGVAPDNDCTGINQNSEEVGRMAVQILISLIHCNQRGLPSNAHVHLATPIWRDGATLRPHPSSE